MEKGVGLGFGMPPWVGVGWWGWWEGLTTTTLHDGVAMLRPQQHGAAGVTMDTGAVVGQGLAAKDCNYRGKLVTDKEVPNPNPNPSTNPNPHRQGGL